MGRGRKRSAVRDAAQGFWACAPWAFLKLKDMKDMKDMKVQRI